jgi:hypothetical protein
MYKYTAGQFQTYGEAATYRDRIKGRYASIVGPFIVAYRDGRRVPIETVLEY